jgi:anti-sigma regulatory factor (Ser/Thr protein kinase)
MPARAENVAVARHVTAALAEAIGMCRRQVENIRLAVTEACTNCVLHAYDGDGADTFALEARVEDDVLVVVVRDAGAGITARSSAKAGLGFGLRLMRQAASSVDVTSRPGRGTRVAMRFALR